MKKAKIILIAASAAMLLAGCMSRGKTEALSAWTVERYTAQAMAAQENAVWQEKRDKIEIEELQIKELVGPSSAPVPVSTPEQAEAVQQEVMPEEAEPREAEPQQPLTAMEMASSKAVPALTPTPAAKEESASAPAEPAPIPRSEWPYITCPPEATLAPKIDWPYPAITCPPESIPTADIPSLSEPVPTPVPLEPAPTPAPTLEPERVETPTAMPGPTPTPAGGYALCSCGTTLTPDELVPHMKAHAMNGENPSYIAY